MLRRFAIPLCLALAACGGPRVSDYAAFPEMGFRAKGINWLVRDYAVQSRLLITPGNPDDYDQGLFRDYNPAVIRIPEATYRGAVEAWLAVNRAGPCQVIDGYHLARPNWEFIYRCGLKPPPFVRGGALPPAGSLPPQQQQPASKPWNNFPK